MVAMGCRLSPILSLLAALLALGTTRLAAQSLPIEINRNDTPAGVLRDGVLGVRLEIAKGEWHPEADDGIALSVYAFGEIGHPLQSPGPLFRVPQGTEIRVSLHNTLAVPINVHGLGDSSGGEAALHLDDVEFSTATARDLLLDLLLTGQKIHTSQTLSLARQVLEKGVK